MRVIKAPIFPLLIIATFILLTFYRLPQTFFQQDEWGAFGYMAILEQDFQRGVQIILPREPLEHFAPISFFLEFLQFKLFRLNFPYYAWLSLLLHFINSVLVYHFFKILSQKKSLSLIGSLIFASNSLSHQAITWISTSTSTQTALMFALISLIFFSLYFKNDYQKNFFLWLSLGAFLISLFCKETSIFLFLFLPFSWYLLAKKRKTSQIKKIFSLLFLLGIIYLSIRLVVVTDLPPIEVIRLGEPVKTGIFNYLYRLVIIPFRALSQSIFSTAFLLFLSKKMIFLAYPHQFILPNGDPDYFVMESIIFDLICFLAALILLILSFLIYLSLKKIKETTSRPLLIFSLSFIIFAGLPFVFIPGRAGYISIFEPRNLHLINVGSSLFLALLISTFSQRVLPWPILFLLPLFFLHFKQIHSDLNLLVERSQIRKKILNQIYDHYPQLPQKVIFYTESDTAYYGMPPEEHILPFQSGFGQTLLVWYFGHGEKIPSCLFENKWLYRLQEDQEYKECQGRGFGYFRKRQDLEKALQENNLSPENVTAFRFNSEDNSLKDITKEIRDQLK